MTTTKTLTVHEALAAVMDDVRAVAKGDFNSHQNFNFRGIDAVMNAVGPALRAHKVMVVPDVISAAYETVQTTTGKASTACRVHVAYTFYGPAGDELRTTVIGESWDAGDKAAPKAMSVAFRTALLQSLCLPTHDPDPDSHSYERAPADPDAEERAALLEQLGTKAEALGIPKSRIAADFEFAHGGRNIRTGTPTELRALLADLEAEAEQVAS